jgi:O-antigen ligase
MPVSDDTAGPYQMPPTKPVEKAVVAVLAWLAFLVPATGVPSELLLQDTLKSAVVSFGVLIAAALLVWRSHAPYIVLRWHALLAIPLVLMVYALGSMGWSHTYLAGVEAVRWFVVSLILLISLNTVRPSNINPLLWGLHAGVFVASVWAALQFWLGFDVFAQAATPASSFANRNFFAEYAVAVLPFSVWLLARMKASRWLAWVALSLAFNCVAILMTGTRSALVALCVVVPVLVLVLIRTRAQLTYLTWGRPRQVMVCLVMLSGIAVLGSWPTNNPKIVQEGRGATALERSFQRSLTLTEPAEYRQGSFSVRSTIWLATARMMIANPLAGVGAGAWEVQIPLYQRSDTTLETDYYAHNELLQLLSEYGLIVGGLSFAFLLAYLLKAAALVWRAPGQAATEAPLRAFVLTSLLALLIVSNAGFPWHLAGGTMLLGLCLGLLAGSDTRQHNPKGRVLASVSLVLSSRDRRIMLAGLACCLSTALYISWQAVRAESKLVRAITLAKAYARAQHAGLPNAPAIKQQALQLAREGMTIHPHYRKLTAEIAEPFSALGDWQATVWILESLTASRPHVAGLWTGLAHGHAALGSYNLANAALLQVQRLRPKALATTTLRATLLAQAGQGQEAAAILERQFDDQAFDWEMTQSGYAIGYQTGNLPLAIRSLELQNATWPEQSASGYFRLGLLYTDPRLADSTRALQAFKAGLATVTADERSNYLSQVPKSFRDQM